MNNYCIECKEYICDLCKHAHEKIRITRTHRILPYGTLLEFNIGKNATVNVENSVDASAVVEVQTHFLDITLSDIEDLEEPANAVNNKSGWGKPRLITISVQLS